MIRPHSLEAVNELYNLELAHNYISEYEGNQVIKYEDFILLELHNQIVQQCCPFNKRDFDLNLVQIVICPVLMEARNQADPATKIEVAMRLKVD